MTISFYFFCFFFFFPTNPLSLRSSLPFSRTPSLSFFVVLQRTSSLIVDVDRRPSRRRLLASEIARRRRELGRSPSRSRYEETSMAVAKNLWHDLQGCIAAQYGYAGDDFLGFSVGRERQREQMKGKRRRESVKGIFEILLLCITISKF